jgi:hypothetical protein
MYDQIATDQQRADSAWKRHLKLTQGLTMHLRFELAEPGRTREAIALIHRIVGYRRLRRLILTNPVCGRLPLVLVWKRNDETDEELRHVILSMYSHLTVYGKYMAEWALDALGDPDALGRAQRLAEQYAEER